MRIVVNGWFVGQMGTGSGHYLDGLLAWLPRSRPAHELLIAVHGPAHSDVPAPWQRIELSTPFDRLNHNLAKVWFEQVAFPAACHRLRGDLALVPYWGSPWWRPCPVVVTIHDLIPLLLPLYRGGALQRVYSSLVSQTAHRADAVLTDSAASRRDIIAHLRIPADQVYAVHLATRDQYRRVTDPARLNAVRARYELPDEPFFLYLGGFDARKNLPNVIEAYAQAVRRAPGRLPALVIAGKLPASDTPFAPDPRRVAERLGPGLEIHFTGWVDEADKPALYSLATAALFVSEYEGFGLPVIEAQACGCPVITSAS